MLGGDPLVLRSLVPRSVTTPIAVEIARTLRGSPPLAAAVSVASGVFGAVIGPPLLRLIGVHRPGSWGFAMGAAAHGVGTARAAEEGESTAAAAGLAIGLMGAATALLAAIAARVLG
jgi:putative effector of murein hydrolase